MSDAIKWGLLVAGIVVCIGLVVGIGFADYIDVDTVEEGVTTLLSYGGTFFAKARGLINNFFFPSVYRTVTFAIWWLILKPVITFSIKITVSIYHYIFK